LLNIGTSSLREHTVSFVIPACSSRLAENRSIAIVRHSGMFLAGIQTRAAVGLCCVWIPAKGMPE
jgi:hypothetical protein